MIELLARDRLAEVNENARFASGSPASILP